jgi:cell division protein FtsB
VLPWLFLGFIYFLKLVCSEGKKEKQDEQLDERVKKLEEEIEELKKEKR